MADSNVSREDADPRRDSDQGERVPTDPTDKSDENQGQPDNI